MDESKTIDVGDTSDYYCDEALVKQKYDEYKGGRITRDEYGTFMCMQLKNYIKKLILDKHFLAKAEFEDLLQDGYVAIIRKLDQFNPYIAAPSTFFTGYILEDARREISNTTGKREYYVTMATRLNKKLKKYGYNGIDDERLTPDMIATLTDVPLSTVMETIKEMSVTTNTDLTPCENMPVTNAARLRKDFQNPLDILIRNEEESDTIAAFGTLSPLQQFLFIRTELADEKRKTREKKSDIERSNEKSSRKELLKILQTPEAKEVFGDELPDYIDQCYIQTQINHARRKLQNNKIMRRYASDAWIRENSVDGYEQATEEDITAAILSGDWDDLD